MQKPERNMTGVEVKLMEKLLKDMRNDLELRKWCVEMSLTKWAEIYSFLTENIDKKLKELGNVEIPKSQ